MATTSIWSVRGWIGKVIMYAENPEKTENPKFSEGDLQGLRDVMNYAMDDYKTEMQYYVSGINCDAAIARQQMILTKKQFRKEGGIVAFHGYQSFAPGEVTPDVAHKIGVELAEQLWGERFEVIVATHLNTNCYHNHFVINSVSFIDGKRYYDNKATYALMRQESDRLCNEHGLSVIKNPEQLRSKHYAEWKAENEGQRTWRSAIREDVDHAIMVSMSFQAFIRSMKEKGYEVVTSGKYMKVRPHGKERFVRLRSLGDDYTEEAIKQRILRQRMPERPPKPAPPVVRRVKVRGDFRLCRVTWKGLRALYFYYLYKLREAQRQPTGQAPFLLREDLRLIDAISEQAKFLHRYRIDTEEQLSSFRTRIKQQIAVLIDERRVLSNQRRCASVSEERSVEVMAKIGPMSAQLKTLRQEAKMCAAILERFTIIADKEARLKQQEQDIKRRDLIKRIKTVR